MQPERFCFSFHLLSYFSVFYFFFPQESLFNLCPWLKSTISGNNLVRLCCMLSNIFFSSWGRGGYINGKHSSWNPTSTVCNWNKCLHFCIQIPLAIKINTLFAFLTACFTWTLTFSVLLITDIFQTFLYKMVYISTKVDVFKMFLHHNLHIHSWRLVAFSTVLTIIYLSVKSSAKLEWLHLILLSNSLTKIVNRWDPNTDPFGTMLCSTSLQENSLFYTTLCFCLITNSLSFGYFFSS